MTHHRNPPSLARRIVLSLAAAASLGGGIAAAQVAAPAASTQPARSAREIVGDIQRSMAQLEQATTAASADPSRRAALAAQAEPSRTALFAALDEYLAANPKAAGQVTETKVRATEQMASLDDAAAKAKLDQMAASATAEEQARGKVAQVRVKWLQAGADSAKQEAIAGDFEALAKADAKNPLVTITLAESAQKAATPALADRLMAAAVAMDSPVVPAIKQMQAQAAASRKLKDGEGKPFTLTGNTPDGTAFSTANWKGKIVLVDFWATWCGPCIQSLPELEALYAKYHDKGLEVVGVSNDYSSDALKKFVAERKIPWTITFDPDAAAKQEWNPTTTNLGINGIPHMLVIGRDGNLVSADARATLAETIAKAIGE